MLANAAAAYAMQFCNAVNAMLRSRLCNAAAYALQQYGLQFRPTPQHYVLWGGTKSKHNGVQL